MGRISVKSGGQHRESAARAGNLEVGLPGVCGSGTLAHAKNGARLPHLSDEVMPVLTPPSNRHENEAWSHLTRIRGHSEDSSIQQLRWKSPHVDLKTLQEISDANGA